jgi:SPOR domain
MGKDTKYLTVALIVLCAIAALIVRFYPSKSKINSNDIHGETSIEQPISTDENTAPPPTKKGELYADNSNSGASPDAVADAYKVLSNDKVSTVDDVPTKSVPKEKVKPAIEVPNAYDQTQPKKSPEKLTEKGGTVKNALKKEEKLNSEKLSGFLVVTNQFGSKDNALKEVAKVKTAGYANANVVTLDNKVFMAYAGHTATKEDAVKLLAQLKKKCY